jgi:predicted transposase YdaD
MNPAIMKAEMQLQKALSDESTRRAYFLREKARNEYVSAMTLAVREGEQKGIQIGEQRGIQIGEQRGRQEERRAIIQGLMSKKGLSVQEIAELISLTTAAGQGIPQGQKRKNQQTSNENNSDHSDTERANFMK